MKLFFAGTLRNKLKACLSILTTGAIELHPQDEEALYKAMTQVRQNQQPHLLQFTSKGNPIFVAFPHVRKDGIYRED